jgi:M6 family metalloprotease-like protein
VIQFHVRDPVNERNEASVSTVSRFLTLLLVVAAFGSIPSIAAGEPRSNGVELAGTLRLLVGEPRPGSGLMESTRILIQSDDESATELLATPSALAMAEAAGAGNIVTVHGSLTERGRLMPVSITPAVSSRSGDAAVGYAAPAARGTDLPKALGGQHWATILCRYADDPAPSHPREWFDRLLGEEEPGVGHYFRTVSYGAFWLESPQSFGWYDLPQPRSYYIEEYDWDGVPREFVDLQKLAEDCTAVADADIHFPEWDGINLAFSGETDGRAYGNRFTITLDGIDKVYGVTWLPNWAWQTQYVVAHEIGHALYLPHSSGGYDSDYDSMWDVMSGGGTCNPPNEEWGCIGVHTIGPYKDRLGWIPDDARFVMEDSGTATVTLDALSEPSGNYLIAVIPIQRSPTRFYTIEARKQSSYDARIPRSAVLIHEVDWARGDGMAVVVDPDGNGDPNDDAAQWVPGETFTDFNGGVSIRVERATATGWVVTITSDDAFRRTWARTDGPVASQAVRRTWMWGPESFTGPMVEEYWDAHGGERTVLYYDKSRMEITHPKNDASSIWYVTNGLLVVEMVTGRIQWADEYWSDPLPPAAINVAGDADDPNGPTYASFRNLMGVSAPAAETAIMRTIRRDGSTSSDTGYVGYRVATTHYTEETGHWIAGPFWDFMNSRGLIEQNGGLVTDALFANPYYAVGYPITDAYWTTVRVGGQGRDVLVQCFERRCLTYTPSNPAGWQVEAGNVGRHYYAWRYGEGTAAGTYSHGRWNQSGAG